MSTKRKSQTRSRGRNNGMFSITLIVIVFLVVMSVQIYRLKQRDDEYRKKEEVLQEQYEAETERAEELIQLEAYMQTDAYIEEVAKSKIGLAYANEIIFKEREE